jgi:hypothetical protein
MTKYWILVASKNHVLQGIAGNFAETCHGKAHPLRRMQVGDGLIYYSPKLQYGETTPYQRFMAIGHVVGEKVYQLQQPDKSLLNRREVNYLTCRDVPVAPLIERLSFIKDKARWGTVFRYDILHVPVQDFKIIAALMLK